MDTVKRIALLVLLAGCAPRPRADIVIGPKDAPEEGKLPANDPVEVARQKALYAISMLEAARPLTPDGFLPHLADANPGVRAAAARGIGRAGEALEWAGGDAAAFVEALLAASRDESTEVRAAVAEAIALVGPRAHGKIRAPFAAETSLDVRRRWVTAAGRVAPLPVATAGTAGAFAMALDSSHELVLLGHALGDDELAPDAGWALGVYGLRSERQANAIPELPPATLEALRGRFKTTAGEARTPYAYALWRLRQRATTQELRLGLSDPHPYVRAWCARGLGATPGTHARRQVGRLLKDPNLWVRVEASRAVAQLADADATAAVDLVDMLEKGDPPASAARKGSTRSPHAAIAAAEALGALRMRATAEPLRARLGTEEPGLFAAVSMAYVKVAGASALPDLAESLEERSGPAEWRARKAIAEALGALERKGEIRAPGAAVPVSIPPEARPLLDALLDDRDERVRAAALDSYAELAGVDARDRLVSALGSNDVAIVSTAADRLAALGPDAGHEAGDEAKAASVDALKRLTSVDPDTAAGIVPSVATLGGEAAVPALEEAAVSPSNALMLAAAKALRGMGRTPPARTVPPSGMPTEEEWRAASDLTRMTIRTKKGDVRLALRPDIAPLNVLNMTSLAKKGYFRGIAFHRVVPAFVVQGGDPRSDGHGGPGHSVPCELSELPYDEMAVGMALSGRDTGGSQLFVTLTPQPHLDRNYTVWGRVVRGEEIVDALEVGDVIVDVTVP